MTRFGIRSLIIFILDLLSIETASPSWSLEHTINKAHEYDKIINIAYELGGS